MIASPAYHNLPHDLDLIERVQLSLRRLDVRGVLVHACGGAVTLRGTVGSYYEKQVSQEFCRRIAGVIRVENAIEVRRDSPSTAPAATPFIVETVLA